MQGPDRHHHLVFRRTGEQQEGSNYVEDRHRCEGPGYTITRIHQTLIPLLMGLLSLGFDFSRGEPGFFWTVLALRRSIGRRLCSMLPRSNCAASWVFYFLCVWPMGPRSMCYKAGAVEDFGPDWTRYHRRPCHTKGDRGLYPNPPCSSDSRFSCFGRGCTSSGCLLYHHLRYYHLIDQ